MLLVLAVKVLVLGGVMLPIAFGALGTVKIPLHDLMTVNPVLPENFNIAENVLRQFFPLHRVFSVLLSFVISINSFMIYTSGFFELPRRTSRALYLTLYFASRISEIR